MSEEETTASDTKATTGNSACDMIFYEKFNREGYDVLNTVPYLFFYATFQFYGFVAILFRDATKVGNLIKYNYLGYQKIYSA